MGAGGIGGGEEGLGGGWALPTCLAFPSEMQPNHNMNTKSHQSRERMFNQEREVQHSCFSNFVFMQSISALATCSRAVE